MIAGSLESWEYLASYPDLMAAFGTKVTAAASHYDQYGLNEGRSISFDASTYLSKYPDLQAAFGSDTIQATQHYIMFGCKEGRTATLSTSGKMTAGSLESWEYLASYPDLITAFGANIAKASAHYNTIGINENRSILFDPIIYLSNNPDLQKAFGTNTLLAAQHYVQFGYAEGRKTNINSFNITLSYAGDSAYATYIEQAKAVWEKVIIGDLPNVGNTDDIKVSIVIVPIDGTGNVLATSMENATRPASGLPYDSVVRIDSADVAKLLADGILAAIVEHELGHALGFGYWSEKGYNPVPGQYTGPNALAEYRTLSHNPLATYVPLETSGGSGTASFHWSESVFDRELMTGYSESSAPMPLSRLTVTAMKDLGYAVDFSAADSFSLNQALLSGLVGVVNG